ncbi:MAG: benzoate/H(+) symporter BenE family transporter [Devosia sp.]
MTHALFTSPTEPGLPVQPMIAGILAAIVGYASTFALVLAGLAAAGATPSQAASGLLASTLAVALLNIVVALRSKVPISFAWSTPGVALLLSIGSPEGGFAATIGAFITAGALVVLAGLWPRFARLVSAIPSSIANAMLAGILLSLCLAPLRAVAELPILALPVIIAWALALKFVRRYAVPVAVFVTVIMLATTTNLPPGAFDQAWPTPEFLMPAFTLDATIRIALPLFVVTMASQNLPGLAVMRANAYNVQPSRLFVLTGLASVAAAPLGGHSVNLAAITAAICAGPEAGPDPARRWIAPVAAGFAYLVLALAAGLAASFIVASPPLLIESVAGLALMTSLAGALAGALDDPEARLPATVTFVTAASGITVLGIGAAFWGILAGLVLGWLMRTRP